MVYRILSLDGGGIRGILSAQILASLETLLKEKTGQTLQEYFHLISGTSTGSIIATGIALGKTAQQMVQLYQENGRRIFPYWGLRGYIDPRRLWLILTNGLSAPKFSNQGLIEVLQEQFGEHKLGDLDNNNTKLLAVSFDTQSRRPLIFKSWKVNSFANKYLWEVCVCSAAAPTFFPSYPLENKTISCVDGGVAANNPTACAVAEAIHLGYKIEDLRVLSVGTGTGINGYPYSKTSHWGASEWATRILDILMAGPGDVAEYIAREIVTSNAANPNHYLRLQLPLDSGYFATLLEQEREIKNELLLILGGKSPKVIEDMDNASINNIATLIALGKVYVQQGTIAIKDDREQIINKSVIQALDDFLEVSDLG